MRTRNIRPTSVSYTGKLQSRKLKKAVYFESSLERDMIFLLEYSGKVCSYQEQPVTIKYLLEGKERCYTPDFFVEYDKEVALNKEQKPILIEVKYRQELWKKWKVLKPKYQAALRYAADKGWGFKIMTEVEIRTPYLDNVRFLLNYCDLDLTQDYLSQLLDKIKCLQEFTIEDLMSTEEKNSALSAQMIQGLWYLVANGMVQADLNSKLCMQSKLRYNHLNI